MSVLSSKTPRRSFFRSALGLAALPFAGKAARATEAGRYTAEGQPIPARALISHLRVGGRWFTAIFRKWAPGDETKCRLCDQCHAIEGECMVTIGRFVPNQDARLYSSVGKIRPNNPNNPESCGI